MSDLVVTIKFHHVGIICRRAFSRWRARATLSGMRGREHGIGADAPPLLINSERLYLIPCVGHEGKQRSPPFGVLCQTLDSEQGFSLRGKSRIGGTLGLAAFPASTLLTSFKERAGGLCNRGHLRSPSDMTVQRRILP